MVLLDSAVITNLTATPGVDAVFVECGTQGPTSWVEFAYGPTGATDLRAIRMVRGDTDESDPANTYWSAIVTGVQPANDSEMTGFATTQDGIVSTVTWMQTGLNASPDDMVHFPDQVQSHIRQISAMAARFSNEEKILASDYQQFVALVALTTIFNDITWEDGR